MITLNMLTKLDGWTLHIPTMTIVTKGYAVAMPGHTLKMPKAYNSNTITGKAVDYAKGLGTEYLGKWTDEAGNIWIEPTEIYDDLMEAMSAGMERSEIAIYDLNEGREIKIDVSLTDRDMADLHTSMD